MYLLFFFFLCNIFHRRFSEKIIRTAEKQSTSPKKTFVITFFFNIITLGENILTIDENLLFMYQMGHGQIEEASCAKIGFTPPTDKSSARKDEKSNCL